MVYHEKDDAFFLDVTITKDHKWILISGNAKQTSEVRLLDAEKIATSQPIVVQPRSSGVRYFLDHAEDTFFCVTDRDGAHNFKLLTAKASEMLPALQNTSSSPIPWREMVPHSETLSINDVDVFQVGSSHVMVNQASMISHGNRIILCYTSPKMHAKRSMSTINVISRLNRTKCRCRLTMYVLLGGVVKDECSSSEL